MNSLKLHHNKKASAEQVYCFIPIKRKISRLSKSSFKQFGNAYIVMQSPSDCVAPML